MSFPMARSVCHSVWVANKGIWIQMMNVSSAEISWLRWSYVFCFLNFLKWDQIGASANRLSLNPSRLSLSLSLSLSLFPFRWHFRIHFRWIFIYFHRVSPLNIIKLLISVPKNIAKPDRSRSPKVPKAPSPRTSRRPRAAWKSWPSWGPTRRPRRRQRRSQGSRGPTWRVLGQ